MSDNLLFAEYIWLDGTTPTQELRSKMRVVSSKNLDISDFPEWSFDGSSTGQAEGHDSDCALRPVYAVRDPLREGYALVLCEVNNIDGTAHSTNKRAALRELMATGAGSLGASVGFEQEYVLTRDGRPLGFPETGYPGPQGPYYCSVGASNVFGRKISEKHLEACVKAGFLIYGTNAEVMPGQWEFQLGYRFKGEDANPLLMSDQLWLARYLLHRIGEDNGVSVSLDNKPMKGDWNGSGMHTNFSTNAMMSASTGKATIEKALKSLEKSHKEHIDGYGAKNDERLTGAHETCSINEFRFGDSDRGASIRIPPKTQELGYGYLEDRRPGANADPYVVGYLLLKSISEDEVLVAKK